MITKMFDAIEEVLHSLDVGGEQSRAFAEEIKILKKVIGYPEPPKDVLDEIERRGLIVRKLRILAVEAEGLIASLPTLPVENWLDGTVADATKDVYFKDYDLAKLLAFIADVGVSDGMTVEQFFNDKMPGRKAHDFLIRVNRQPVPCDYVLKENDRVTITPTKIEGART